MIESLPKSTINNTGDIRVTDGNTVNTWNVEHANYVEKTHHYIPYTTEVQDHKKQSDKIFDGDQWITHDTWHYKYLSVKDKYECDLNYYTMHPQQKSVAKQNELNKMKRKVDEYKRICDQLCADCRYCKYYWRGSRV